MDRHTATTQVLLRATAPIRAGSRRLRLGNGRGFPRDKLRIWTALRPDGGQQQVRAAILPILRHFVVAPSGDDRKTTEDPDFDVPRLHHAIVQAGTLAIDVTRLAVDDGR